MAAARGTRPATKDHLKPAAQREAEGVGTVDIEYNGHTFRIVAEAQDWKAGAIRDFENGRAVEAVRKIVGEAKWDRLDMDDWSGRQVNELFEKFAKAAGFDSAGE